MAEELFAKNNIEADGKVYSTLNNLLKVNLIGETDINMLGYKFLGEQKNQMAISIFKFNTEKYPESANVWDSLAEAYMNAGNDELAIKNYEKALELNPQNTNAVELLKKLKEK